MPTQAFIWIALAYACGSTPFALLIGLARGVDIRKQGSGNVGATNVGRVLGRRWGVLCFVLDVLKGLLPVLGAGAAMGLLGSRGLSSAQAWWWLAVGGAAVVGHVFPIWLRFKGGKGVATSLGVLLGFWPVLTLPGALAGLTWVALIKATRYVSVASIGAAVMLPLYFVGVSRGMDRGGEEFLPFLVVSILLALLVVVRHRANIARLRAGTENRVGASKAPDQPRS